jgi:hypothetical protein
MQYYHKKANMICFDPEDLKSLFEAPTKARIAEETLKSGYTSVDLMSDRKKMQEIVDKISIINGKEDIEIFCALYVFPQFYQGESKICFLLENGFNPIKTPIYSLLDLKSALKEKDLTDFLFLHNDGFRAFQLKSYHGKAELMSFFAFLKKKLLHYANDLSDVNLLINLQSEGDIPENFFEGLHERLKTLELKGAGHVLVTYNEENKFDVMNTVYPILGTKRIPFKIPTV